MLQVLFISVLFLLSIYFLCGALRSRNASKAMDEYVRQFSHLADNHRAPLEVIEALHTVFKVSCHPCTTLILTREIIRFRLDKSYRFSFDEKKSPELEGLEPAVCMQIAKTTVALYTYVSYGLPAIGLLARRLLRSFGRREDDKRRSKFLVFTISDAAA